MQGQDPAPRTIGSGSGKDERFRGDGGASLVEYALLVSLIMLVAIMAVQFLGNEASTSFSTSGSSIAAASP